MIDAYGHEMVAYAQAQSGLMWDALNNSSAERESVAADETSIAVDTLAAHANEMDVNYIAAPSPRNAYEKGVADAALAWGQSAATAINNYHDALTTAGTVLVASLSTSISASAQTAQITDMAYGFSVAQGIKTWWTDQVGAISSFGVDIVTAQATRTAAGVAAEVAYNNGKAAAAQTHANDVAIANVAWVVTMAQANMTYYIDSYCYYMDPVCDSAPAQAAYDAALAAADSTRDAAHRAANVTHATNVGTAQYARATALGDAEIAFVGSVGQAAVSLISGSGNAEAGFNSTVSTAMTTWMGAMAVVENAHMQNLTNGMATLAAAVGNAELGLQAAIGTADVTLAGALTTAEANYVESQAQQEAAAANTLGMTGESLAQANAASTWTSSIKSGIVSFATASAQAGTNFANGMAGAVVGFGSATASAEAAFIVGTDSVLTSFENNMTSTMMTLDADVRSAGLTYSVASATAEKEYAVDLAEDAKASAQEQVLVDQSYYQGWFGLDPEDTNYDIQVQTLDFARRDAEANADLNSETRKAGAEMTWRIDQAAADRDLQIDLATAIATAVTSMAGHEKTLIVGLANQDGTLTNTIAGAEAGMWNGMTGAENGLATGLSGAIGGLVSSGLTAGIASAGVLNSSLGTDFTQFQLDKATADQNWWTTMQPDYNNLTVDVNAVHTDYQAAVGTAYTTMVSSMVTAGLNMVTDIAESDRAYAAAEAAADQAYSTSLANAGYAYAVAQAGAESNWRILQATAARDSVVTGSPVTPSPAAYDAAIAAANSAYTVSSTAAEGVRSVAVAQAEVGRVTAAAQAEVAWTSATELANRTYTEEEASYSAILASQTATISRDYAQLEAQTYATSMSSFAAANNTPWAVLEADRAWADLAAITATTNAETDRTIAQTDADRDLVIARVQGEQTRENNLATAAQTRELAAANAALTRAQQQQNEANAAAAAGTLTASGPGAASAPALDGLFTVAGSSSGDFFAWSSDDITGLVGNMFNVANNYDAYFYEYGAYENPVDINCMPGAAGCNGNRVAAAREMNGGGNGSPRETPVSPRENNGVQFQQMGENQNAGAANDGNNPVAPGRINILTMSTEEMLKAGILPRTIELFRNYVPTDGSLNAILTTAGLDPRTVKGTFTAIKDKNGNKLHDLVIYTDGSGKTIYGVPTLAKSTRDGREQWVEVGIQIWRSADGLRNDIAWARTLRVAGPLIAQAASNGSMAFGLPTVSRLAPSVARGVLPRVATKIVDNFDDFAAARNLVGKEAERAFFVYQRASQSKGLIIGSSDDIVNHGAKGGFDMLFGNPYSRAINRAWIDGAIDAGKPITIITADITKHKTLLWEIGYAMSRGYNLVGNTLVPALP